MKNKALDYLGWYGVLVILLAYLLVSLNVVGARSAVYQLLNLTGALCIVAEAGSKKDAQPMILNAVWAIIAAVALIRLLIGH